MKTELQNVIESTNGLRRTRLLDHHDIMYAAEQLKPGEHTFLHGGHVANCYGYRAVATGAVVFRPKGKRTAYVLLSEVNATKGSTGFGQERCWTHADDLGSYVRITQQDWAIYYSRELRGDFDDDTPWEIVSDWWADHGNTKNARLCKALI